MAEPLTSEAAKRVGDEHANRVADVTSEQGVGEGRSLESEDEETGILPFAVSEGRQTADM